MTTSTISYNLNGGTLNGKTGTVTLSVENGTTITLPAPTREGYTFDYWEGSRYNAGDSYTVNGDHTFTAQWKKNSTTPGTGRSRKDLTSDRGRKQSGAVVYHDDRLPDRYGACSARYSQKETAGGRQIIISQNNQ